MKRVQFFWGFDWMFLFGVRFGFSSAQLAFGPLYLEWYW